MNPHYKCGYADRYQAIREPVYGCVTCWLKWLEKREAELRPPEKSHETKTSQFAHED